MIIVPSHLLHAGFLLSWYSTLKTEALRSSETSVLIQTTPRFISEDGNIKCRFSLFRKLHLLYNFRSDYKLFRRILGSRQSAGITVPMYLNLVCATETPIWMPRNGGTVCSCRVYIQKWRMLWGTACKGHINGRIHVYDLDLVISVSNVSCGAYRSNIPCQVDYNSLL
jgi:hypothetical protein